MTALGLATGTAVLLQKRAIVFHRILSVHSRIIMHAY